MKNKKGDIPITILVIGIFAVCGFALLSFMSANIKLKDSLEGIGTMEKINIQIEENLMEKNITEIYIEKNDSYWKPELGTDWRKEKIIFSVRYYP